MVGGGCMMGGSSMHNPGHMVSALSFNNSVPSYEK